VSKCCLSRIIKLPYTVNEAAPPAHYNRGNWTHLAVPSWALFGHKGSGRPGRHFRWGGTLGALVEVHVMVKERFVFNETDTIYHRGGKNETCPERHVLLVRNWISNCQLSVSLSGCRRLDLECTT